MNGGNGRSRRLFVSFFLPALFYHPKPSFTNAEVMPYFVA
jgi:hypothetical protein